MLRYKLIFYIVFISFSGVVQASVKADKALAWLFTQQNIDGSWGEGLRKPLLTAKALEILHDNDLAYGSAYYKGFSYLYSVKLESWDFIIRRVNVAKQKNIKLVNDLLKTRTLERGWGYSQGYAASILDTAYVLQYLGKQKTEHGLAYSAEHIAYIQRLTKIIRNKKNQQGVWGSQYQISEGGSFLETLAVVKAFYVLDDAGLLSSSVKDQGIAEIAYEWLMDGINQEGQYFRSTDTSDKILNAALIYNMLNEIRNTIYYSSTKDFPNAKFNSIRSNLESNQVADGSIKTDMYLTLLYLGASEIEVTDNDGDGIPNNAEIINGSDPDVAEHDVKDNRLIDIGFTEVILINKNYNRIVSGFNGYMDEISGNLPPGINYSTGRFIGKATVPGEYLSYINVYEKNEIFSVIPIVFKVVSDFDFITDTDKDGLADSWELKNGWSPNYNGDRAEAKVEAESKDTDGDGLSDYFELKNNLNYLSADEDKMDSDNDGINDALEFSLGLDPYDNDSDGDGITDGWERKYALNPLNSSDAAYDNDSDRLNNKREYLIGTNPNKKDTDADKLDDYTEYTNSLDPNKKLDTDGDTMPDDWEHFYGLSKLSNSDKLLDLDSDGLTNFMEYSLYTLPNNVDTDNDNVSDGDEYKVGRIPTLNEPAMLISVLSVLR